MTFCLVEEQLEGQNMTEVRGGHSIYQMLTERNYQFMILNPVKQLIRNEVGMKTFHNKGSGDLQSSVGLL